MFGAIANLAQSDEEKKRANDINDIVTSAKAIEERRYLSKQKQMLMAKRMQEQSLKVKTVEEQAKQKEALVLKAEAEARRQLEKQQEKAREEQLQRQRIFDQLALEVHQDVQDAAKLLVEETDPLNLLIFYKEATGSTEPDKDSDDEEVMAPEVNLRMMARKAVLQMKKKGIFTS